MGEYRFTLTGTLTFKFVCQTEILTCNPDLLEDETQYEIWQKTINMISQTKNLPLVNTNWNFLKQLRNRTLSYAWVQELERLLSVLSLLNIWHKRMIFVDPSQRGQRGHFFLSLVVSSMLYQVSPTVFSPTVWDVSHLPYSKCPHPNISYLAHLIVCYGMRLTVVITQSMLAR